MTRTTSRLVLATLVMALAAATAQGAATIVIINNDPAGVGFNDPTPVAPVGGNPGTTIGQQRLNVFNQAASIWGAALDSTVTINVQATWEALTCDATSAVLGSCGTLAIDYDFANAPFTQTWYTIALANRLSMTDLDPTGNDMRARFNVNLGTAGCLEGSGWYYGYDGNEGTLIDFLAVLLHEMGHGLGFQTFTNGQTGAWYNGPPQLPSMSDHFLLDETTGLVWSDPTETNANRQASALSVTNLTWNGTNVTANVPTFLARQPRLIVTAPPAAAGSYVATPASTFGGPLTDPGFVGATVVAAIDGGGASTIDGCEAITNGAAVAGNIAYVDRGTCSFVIKVKNCQDAGAVAVVVANNQAGTLLMGGTDATIVVPAVSISQADGLIIRPNLPATADLGLNTLPRAGTNAAGRVMMYAPSTYSAGSSVSHWDTTALPNLLMEPNINADLDHSLDLTIEHFRDIGWFVPVPVELMFFELE